MLFAARGDSAAGTGSGWHVDFDHEPEEIKHQVSISTAFHSLSWKKHSLDRGGHTGLRGLSRRFNQLYARFWRGGFCSESIGWIKG